MAKDVKKEEKKAEKEADISKVVGGTLNLFGMKIDLGKLISSPEEVEGQLEKLRERLKQLGGKEILTEEEWKRGGATVSGYIRTHGALGEREYHIGTITGVKPEARPPRAPKEKPEVIEPPIDIFDEPQQVTIVAEVPGVGQEDLDLRIEDRRLSISSKPTARRSYRKDIELAPNVDPKSMQSTCRNGVLEIRLRKKAA